MLDLDLLVVGAGPAGIAVAGEARAAGIAPKRIAVIEKSESHSASIRSLYPHQKPVTANYKGIDAQCEGRFCLTDCSKDELLSLLDDTIEREQILVRYGEAVYSVDPLGLGGAGFEIKTSAAEYVARVVVVAIGVFGRPKKPDYKLPRSLRDRIHFDVTSATIRNEDVLVVGGGDSAAEYCSHLIQAGNRVTLSYRRGELTRMHPANRRAVLDAEREGALDLWLASSVSRVADDGGRPAVAFERGAVTSQRFDRVIYALGGSTPTNLLRSFGIEIRDDTPVLSDGFETTLPGLYLAGDLAAGKRGGSIIAAFNSSRRVMRQICDSQLGCQLAPV